jgi:hypothetical protein
VADLLIPQIWFTYFPQPLFLPSDSTWSSSHMQHGHLSIVYYNHRSSSHMQHLASIYCILQPQVIQLYATLGHLSIEKTATGHPAICNTWTFIYYILQPQVIQLYATPGHPSMCNTTTGHPAICNTWTVHLLEYNHRSSSHMQHLESPSIV